MSLADADWKRLYTFEPHHLELDAPVRDTRAGSEPLRMHYLDEAPSDGRAAEKPCIVAVHGNPTWSFYYRSIAEHFSKSHRVLAIDQKPEPDKDAKSMIGTVATLEIPATASEVMVSALAQAKQSGVLMLVLRGVSDTAGGPSRGGGANSSNTSSMVRVHRAGVMTEVKVSP
jgi:hypothetical protein